MDFYEWSFKDLLKVSNRGIPQPMTKKIVYPELYKKNPGYGLDKK